MAPIRVDALHFSPDTRVFLRLLHAHRVRYHNLLDAIDGVGFKDLEDLQYLGASRGARSR